MYHVSTQSSGRGRMKGGNGDQTQQAVAKRDRMWKEKANEEGERTDREKGRRKRERKRERVNSNQ
jgi:hypothetical protein